MEDDDAPRSDVEHESQFVDRPEKRSDADCSGRPSLSLQNAFGDVVVIAAIVKGNARRLGMPQHLCILGIHLQALNSAPLETPTKESNMYASQRVCRLIR